MVKYGKPWKVHYIPQQHSDFNSFAYRVPQYCLHGQIVGRKSGGLVTPEVNIGLLKPLNTEFGQEQILLGTSIRSGSMVFSTHEFQFGGHTPVCDINVFMCFEKMQADCEH